MLSNNDTDRVSMSFAMASPDVLIRSAKSPPSFTTNVSIRSLIALRSVERSPPRAEIDVAILSVISSKRSVMSELRSERSTIIALVVDFNSSPIPSACEAMEAVIAWPVNCSASVNEELCWVRFVVISSPVLDNVAVIFCDRSVKASRSALPISARFDANSVPLELSVCVT